MSFLQHREMERQTRAWLEKLGIELKSIRQAVRYLSGGQRQSVALARAVAWGSKVVVLDEPTAALGVKETAKALELIRRLKETAMSIVLVSHNMQNVFAVADRAIVLRHGQRVGSRLIRETTGDEIVRMITGSDLIAQAAGGPS